MQHPRADLDREPGARRKPGRSPGLGLTGGKQRRGLFTCQAERPAHTGLDHPEVTGGQPQGGIGEALAFETKVVDHGPTPTVHVTATDQAVIRVHRASLVQRLPVLVLGSSEMAEFMAQLQ